MSANLEQRIATALGAAGITSTELDQLIIETEAAIAAASEAAVTERVRALDPALSPDPRKARAAAEDAQFACDRLRTLLPRLKACWEQIALAEAVALWRIDLETVRTERDAMVKELNELYPAAVAQIIDLLDRIAAVDQKVGYVNGHAPAGTTERLHGVEREARGRLEQPDVLLSQGLQLPRLHRRSGESIMAYPPPAPSFAAQAAGMAVPQSGIYGQNWHELLDKRDAELQQEGKRLSAYYDQREAEAKERRERELREART
jgi:hypothetical protein